jgi:hypothetical protein
MFSRYAVLFLVTLFIIGCGSTINEGAFTRIKPNMSLQEVEALLGKGQEMTDEEVIERLRPPENAPAEDKTRFENEKDKTRGLKGVRWKAGKKVIVVLLAQERVQQKYKEGF